MKRIILLISSLILCSCETSFPVSFHMEVGDGNSRKFTIPQKGKYFDKVPFVTHKDFETYRSFPASDGMTYGVVFQAKSMAKPRIEAYSANNLGLCILPMVNGHPMEMMQLRDRPITTGQLVVWGGFSAADLATLSEVVPPTPEEAGKNMKSFSKDGVRYLSAGPDDKEEDKSSSDTDSQGRKIISEHRGRF